MTKLELLTILYRYPKKEEFIKECLNDLLEFSNYENVILISNSLDNCSQVEQLSAKIASELYSLWFDLINMKVNLDINKPLKDSNKLYIIKLILKKVNQKRYLVNGNKRFALIVAFNFAKTFFEKELILSSDFLQKYLQMLSHQNVKIETFIDFKNDNDIWNSSDMKKNIQFLCEM